MMLTPGRTLDKRTRSNMQMDRASGMQRDILCEDQAINPFPSNSSCTARPIGERVVHKLSILAPFILYRSLYMLDPFVCTPLFLPSAARPHGNEAKNPDFFLARCIFLPSFLPYLLLAGFYPWDRRHPGLSGSSLISQTLQAESTQKKKTRQKIVRKFSAPNIQMSLPKAVSCILFWDTLRYRCCCCCCCFFLLIISASLQPFMLGSFSFFNPFFFLVGNAAFFMLDRKSFVIGFRFERAFFSGFLFFHYCTPFVEYVKLPCDKFFFGFARFFPRKRIVVSIVFHITLL